MSGLDARVADLLSWYQRARRDLPWRRTRDPWRLLVAEVMLQQTQAVRVAARWEPFLARFPSPRDLAAAPAAEVLRAWSGLGYNRRALRLREAAGMLARGGWPRSASALSALPGVGAYTAAAVASFAWDEPVPALDTNARRVIERWDGQRRPPAVLRARARQLQPVERAAEFNQAMMELGAVVCRARRPTCAQCPVRRCASRGPSSAAVPARGPRPTRRRDRGFEGSDRWLRGRVVAALAAGSALPDGLEGSRGERVLAGLERDGLVARGDGGRLRLP